MSNALFAFDQPEAAQRAVDRLIQAGLPNEAIQLHRHETRAGQSTASVVDELITGGMVVNFRNLFRNLLEWGSTPHDPVDYAEIVDRGGAVISVEARSHVDRDRDALGATKEKRSRRTSMDATLERVKGIEPSYEAWEAAVLPLNYTRERCGF